MDENIRIISKGPVRLQYYVPFCFDENHFDRISQAFRSKVREGCRCWEPAPFPLSDHRKNIYDHVISIINDPENGVCRNWRYLMCAEEKYLLKDSFAGDTEFSVTDVYAHLFRSGVGFLCYQLVIENNGIRTSGQLVRFQQKIRELKQAKLFIRGNPEDKAVLAGSLISDILIGICDGLSFFGDRENSRIPLRALLFSYLCYECEDRGLMQEVTVHAATGYSRLNTQSENSIRSCRSLSENVCFYVSANGCAVSVRMEDQNSHFFLNNPPVQYYHFIYLFSLYQHYSLLHFTMRISREFPSDAETYLRQPDYADRMQDYITDLSTFLMKSDVATVSLEPYHNIFYDACRQALSIEEDKQSIRSGFESLVSIQSNMQISRQKQIWHDEQNQQEDLDIRINILAVVLAILALFPELGNISIWIRIGIVVFIAAAALVHFLRKKRSGHTDDAGPKKG